MSYFPDPPTRSRVEVSLNLENYATKDDLKGVTGIDTSSFTKNTDFNKLKQDVETLQNEPHTTDDDTKKELQEIKTKIAAHETSRAADKKKFESGIKALDNKIKNEASKSDLLAQKTLLTGLIDKKASLEDFTFVRNTQQAIMVRSENNEKDVKSLKIFKSTVNTKFAAIDKKINDGKDATGKDLSSIKTKVSDNEKKIKSMDAKIKTGVDKPEILDNYKFIMGRNFFTGSDGFQNLLIYPPVLPYIETMVPTDQRNLMVKNWKSSGLLGTPLVGRKGTAPAASMKNYIFEIYFDRTYLTGGTDINIGVTNIYLVYEFIQWSPDFGNTHAFHNCLFGATDQKYNGRGIAFDSSSTWTHSNGKEARNVIIFGTDNSKSTFQSNKAVNITTLGRDYLDKLVSGKTIQAEKMFDVNFTEANKKFVLSLHYNGSDSYLYVNSKQIYKFTAQNRPVTGKTINLGIISNDFPTSEAKEVALQGKVYEFSVDFRKRTIDDIENIHTYLIKKHEISG